MITAPDADVVRAVVVAGHRGQRAIAREALGHRSPAVRLAAIGALRRCQDYSAVDLIANLVDPDMGVRRRAAEVAPELHSQEGTTSQPSGLGAALMQTLADPEPLVAEMAAWALGEFDPPAIGSVEAISEMVRNNEDALCREAAAAALGSLGDAEGLPAILDAMDDIATVRRRAVLALAPFDTPKVDAALTAALEDRDWQVRQGAEDLLGVTSDDPD